MTAVILAGGFGTRLADSCRELPKPMLPVCGKPVLEHQIHILRREGIQILSPELLKLFPREGKADLDKDLLRPAVNTGRLFAYKSTEYVRDMGTPERYTQVQTDVSSGLVRRRNRSFAQKAVFLDRDGTLNVYREHITKPEQIELLPGAAKAIATLNRKGYLTVLVTNQPVIAKGMCTQAQLRTVHDRLETLLGKEGAYLDAIYFCPHHPEKGFAGERPEYKIPCACRKPSPGMLLQAAEDLHISLQESYMIGDSDRDVQAGRRAGCTPVLLHSSADLYAFAASLPPV